MLLSYLSLFLACGKMEEFIYLNFTTFILGFVSALFEREHTPAERARILVKIIQSFWRFIENL
jgi:hypothetical protein